MRKKINSRFIGITLFSIIITMAVVNFVFYTQLKKQVFSDLEVIADLLAEDKVFDKDTQNLRITVIEPDGAVSFDSVVDEQTMENHSDRPEIAEAKQSGAGKGVRMSDTLSESVFYYARFLDYCKFLESIVFFVKMCILKVAGDAQPYK